MGRPFAQLDARPLGVLSLFPDGQTHHHPRRGDGDLSIFVDVGRPFVELDARPLGALSLPRGSNTPPPGRGDGSTHTTHTTTRTTHQTNSTPNKHTHQTQSHPTHSTPNSTPNSTPAICTLEQHTRTAFMMAPIMKVMMEPIMDATQTLRKGDTFERCPSLSLSFVCFKTRMFENTQPYRRHSAAAI